MNSEGKRLILVIAESIDLPCFARERLKSNFRVVESNSGEQGLSLARQVSPDIIICDIFTPVLGGLAICAALKSDNATSSISIILVGPVANEIDGLRAGADDYIFHPFDVKVLGLKIENLVQLREALQSQPVQGMSAHSEPSVQGNKLLGKLRQFISENISHSDFGVHEMALHMGISVSALYRKLRIATGGTVNEFVKTIRMEKAKQLLEAGIYSVSEVAMSVGYEDTKYFSREFRKAFGKTPIEVKRNIITRCAV